MLARVFYAVMSAVLVLALLRGGRAERRTALAIAAGAVISGAMQAALQHNVPAGAFLALDFGILVFHVRTWRFRHARYLVVVIAAQVGVVLLDAAWLAPEHPRGVVYQHLAYGLLYVRLGALLAGVTLRWITVADLNSI